MRGPVSRRADRASASPTLAISSQAKALAGRFNDVISLAAGEPDTPTPRHIVEAGVDALHQGATRYLPVAGLPALRRAIADQSGELRGWRPDATGEVLVTCGAKHALFHCFQVLLEPGDKVLLSDPAWVSYGPQIRLADGEPVVVPSTVADGFYPSVEALEAAFDDRCRASVINSPNNPTGLMARPDQVEAITRWAARRKVWLISDEIYSRISFSDAPQAFSPVQVKGADIERILVVDGVSKAYAMTGWRVGWVMGPKSVVSAASRMQSHQTSSATSVSQYAALAALDGPQNCVDELVALLEKRRDLVMAAADRLEQVDVLRPQGAFYAFLDLRAALRTGEDDNAFCRELLDREHLALVPGSAFGAPGHARLSMAASEADLTEGFERLARFLAARS